MMNSMTGFGRGEVQDEQFEITLDHDVCESPVSGCGCAGCQKITKFL